MKFCLKCQHLFGQMKQSPNSITGRLLVRQLGTADQDLSYVPKHEPVQQEDVEILQRFMEKCKKVLIITGAGISTESGVPDYRSEEVGLYARSNHKPIQYQEFLAKETVRKRYWARNYVGFENFAKFKPNSAHLTLATWEIKGRINWIVTQNVDQLHQKAGSLKVTELHGSGFTVRCLNARTRSCDFSINRHVFQEILHHYNPQLKDVNLDNIRTIRPDGDVDLNPKFVEDFKIPRCPNCDGILKPDIIFFGDNVPKERVDFVFQKLNQSDALIVIGSSLQVYSAHRFVLAASEKCLPIMLINIGPSRADSMKNVTFIKKRAGELLPLVKL